MVMKIGISIFNIIVADMAPTKPATDPTDKSTLPPVNIHKSIPIANVTEVTIRRNLEKLENEGFLKRTHGGAILLDYLEETIGENEESKDVLIYHEIADTAYHLVSDGDAIMLINGTVNAYIARALATHSNLTIVTNDLLIT